MRKRVFLHVRTAKAQISLHIHIVWSGPSLSTNKIISLVLQNVWTGERKPRWYFVHVQDDTNSHILCIRQDTFLLAAAHIVTIIL